MRLVACTILGLLVAIGSSLPTSRAENVDESAVTVLTDDNFETKVKSAKYALGFRPKYAAAAAALTKAHPDLLVAKLDADEHKQTGEHYLIDSFPTIKWFEAGEELAEYDGELNARDLEHWVSKVINGATTDLKSASQIENIKTDHTPSLVAYLKHGNDGDVYTVLRKLSLSDSLARFYTTQDATLAKQFGIDTTGEYGIAVVRNYKNFPFAIVQFKGHRAEKATSEEESSLFDRLSTFFHAEKMPDFVTYRDAKLDNGAMIMSTNIELHMYVVGPAEKLDNPKVLAAMLEASKALRGDVVIISAEPTDEEQDLGSHPVAETFDVDPKIKDVFVGVISMVNSKRFDCEIKPRTLPTADELIKCGEAAMDGTAKRILTSQPVPEQTTKGNITIAVGSTVGQIAGDPTKDVLLEIYAPWCGACQNFAPDFTRVAAVFAGIDSVVVVKMDGADNDHPDYDIEEFPTLLFYPAAKDAAPIKIETMDIEEIVDLVHKNAKIPFTKPDLAPFKAMEVEPDDDFEVAEYADDDEYNVHDEL